MRHRLPLSLFFICLLFSVHATTGCRTAHVARQTTLNDSITPTDSLLTDSLETDSADGKSIPERLTELLANDIFERTQVGLYVYDLTADSVLFAYNERQCMRPASTMKVVTAVTALHELGGKYLYRTSFYADRALCDSDSIYSGHIYIRGGYDPLIDRDDLRAFAQVLKAHGVKRLPSSIRLDLTFKDGDRLGWGWCWDDDVVPLTPLLYRNRDSFVDNLRETLREEGIDWDGTTEEATVPAKAEELCTRTHSIDQILLPMMKKSDNSMAESLFYQIAAAGGQSRVGRKQASNRINALIRHIGLDPTHYQVADGSGLSLYNYATPELLGKLLRFAYREKDIYTHLLPSLPVAGEDGTLRKRMRGSKAEGNVAAKTGTVEGVSTLAGYCTTAEGHTLCFSIMNQGVRHTSTGRNFQDRVCKALCR